MNKFFVNKEQVEDNKIYIKGEDLKHIDRVLRLKSGDTIIISCNGKNYLCKLDEILKDRAVFNIVSEFKAIAEPPIDITLFQGFPKGSKMEFIAQKGTEVGIKDFYGVLTHRTVIKFKDNKKINSKINRLNKIIKEAAKQSKRDYVPKINRIYNFDEMLENLQGEKNIIIPYEEEESTGLKEVLESIEEDKINLIIGPEGGFEPKEIEKLKKLGGKTVSLGPRILRTETAGVITASIILYELGDLGVKI